MSETALPSIVLAIPVRNEAEHLSELFDFIQEEHYPGIRQILFALAPSTDRSEMLLQAFKETDDRVLILQNPHVTAATGLNLCLFHAKEADFFVRLDAHARYPKGYLFALTQAAQKSGALNTGGVQQFSVENTLQLATAVVLTAVSDIGLNKWRNPRFTGFTDTVYLGCYPLETLRRIGGFSEDQPTNQDAELNQRLNNIRKNAVYQDGSIKILYAPRKQLSSLAAQYFGYGRGRFVNSLTHWPKIPLRIALAPVLAIFSIVALIVKPVLLAEAFLLLSISGYLLGIVYRSRFQLQKQVPLYPLLVEVPLVVFTMIFFFSAGMVKQMMLEWKFSKQPAALP
jgi:glycosyltransferase involved in cell wall biosynthesis